MPERVRITDVSPRDGLQNEAGVISTADKILLADLLIKSNVDEVEVSSFVSAKWVPQLGDAAEVFAGLGKLHRCGGWGVRGGVWSALVPNEKGMAAAMDVSRAAGTQLIDKIAVFTAASETFSRKNTNASIAETIERFKPVVAMALEHDLEIRGYISCAIACPFEGPIDPARVARVAVDLINLGVSDLDIADTIGAATPETLAAMLDVVGTAIRANTAGPFGYPSVPTLTLHLHDTFGRAADCVRTALDLGIYSFDGSVAGLGGCPYASKKLPDGTIQRAPGNISTELLVRTVHGAGFETGVDLDALARAADFAREVVARSRAGVSRRGAQSAEGER
jgi:hydroxymethylglutaryl-CoA lyase